MCIYDIIDELMNINEIKCKTSNQIFTETLHDNSMRFSANTLFYHAQYYSIKSRPLSMTKVLTIITFGYTMRDVIRRTQREKTRKQLAIFYCEEIAYDDHTKIELNIHKLNNEMLSQVGKELMYSPTKLLNNRGQSNSRTLEFP